MAYWRDYHLPTSVEEALDILEAYNGEARLLAGGTDLILEMQEGRRPPVVALVDVTRIPDVNGIFRQNGYIYVGAGVTHTRIVKSELLQRHAACLVESCGVIGGPQVRNVATIGGNVAHALPAADGAVSLLALDAEAQVASQHATVWKPLPELFAGPGVSTVDQTRELIVAFRFKQAESGEGSAFERIMRPQGVALPILAVAVRVALDDERQRFRQVNIVIGPAGPAPFRARQAEAALVGIKPGEEALHKAIEISLAEARLRTSKYRATTEYRHEMVKVLLRRCLPKAVARAQTFDGAD